MSVKANGTHAKEIAVYFFDMINERATPHMMGKTIIQAKSLLSSGYTKEEVMDVIDFLLNVKKVQIYSLGYVNSSINTALREIKDIKERELAKEQQKKLQKQLASHANETSEVKENDESSKRNQEKARRLRTHVQSRLGKKFDFDMFKK